jgi:IS5 family transposase
MRPNYRNRRLTAEEKERNKGISKIRSAVERVFATLKCRFGWRRARYRGLERNALHLQLLCVALNLRRAVTLLA